MKARAIINLSTLAVISIKENTPALAVVAAFEQEENGNMDASTYREENARLIPSERREVHRLVACGNWATVVELIDKPPMGGRTKRARTLKEKSLCDKCANCINGNGGLSDCVPALYSSGWPIQTTDDGKETCPLFHPSLLEDFLFEGVFFAQHDIHLRVVTNRHSGSECANRQMSYPLSDEGKILADKDNYGEITGYGIYGWDPVKFLTAIEIFDSREMAQRQLDVILEAAPSAEG